MPSILSYGGVDEMFDHGSQGPQGVQGPAGVSVGADYVARKIETSPWKSWYAWRPIKLHGEWVWFEWVFRRCINTYVDMDNWTRYQYGNIFDVLGE